MQRRVALIHAEQVGGEQCGFLAAGAGADFEDRVALVVLVPRQQRQLDLHFQLGQPLAQRLHLLFGKRLQLRFSASSLGHFCRRRQFLLGSAQRLDTVDDRLQLAVFLRQLGKIGTAQPGGRERLAQLGLAADDLVEARFERAFHAASAQPTSALSRAAKSSRRTALCSPLSKSRNVSVPAASSSVPNSTAARAPIRSARRILR